jgi:REP element-mobilizing transposase RayT
MPINAKYKAKYSFGNFYHVFNRASGKQLMFREIQNYYYFLSRLNFYLADYVIIHAKCLIPNHFHFLIEIKEEEDMPPLPKNADIHKIITKKFKNFFLSYSMSFKIMFNQSSNVFAQKYKHTRLYTDEDIRNVLFYIHRNPKHHSVGNWQNYRWSSYNEILYANSKSRKALFMLNLFAGREAYKKAHLAYIEESSEPLKGSEPSYDSF